jgi:predicted protein tyrosine phosphatase
VERLRDWASSLEDRLAHALARGRLGARPRGPAHMAELVICDFDEACARAGGFDAVISIEAPDATPLTGRLARFRAPTEPAHKVLRFYDIDDPRQKAAPARHHVHAGLRFARRHAGRHMLIHCQAGVSRSTALAYAILVDRHDAVGDERAMLERILALRPQACPNRLVVRHADALLGCAGRMVQAVEEHPVIQETRRRNFSPPVV